MQEFIGKERRTTFRNFSGGKCLYRLDWSGAGLDLNALSFRSSRFSHLIKGQEERNSKKKKNSDNSWQLWYNILNRPNGIKLQAILLCIIVMNF